jgi:hypothetical protein
VKEDRIDQDDAVAAAREPHSVDPRSPAQVEDGCRGVGKPAIEDLTRPRELDDPVAFTEARCLPAAPVVGEGLWRQGDGQLVHGWECTVTGRGGTIPTGRDGALVDWPSFS